MLQIYSDDKCSLPIRMNDQLKRLLDHLAATLDPRHQAEIELLHRKALRWEPVPRLPLVLAYPIPVDVPFQPYPHSQVFDNPEKMLFNELVHAFRTSIAYRDRIDDDLRGHLQQSGIDRSRPGHNRPGADRLCKASVVLHQ